MGSACAILQTYEACSKRDRTFKIAHQPAQRARFGYCVLSAVVCLTLQYFSTLSHTQTRFSGKKGAIKHEMYVLIFCTTLVWNISQSKKNSARFLPKCTKVYMQGPLYSCHVLMKHEFSRHRFSKNTQIWTFGSKSAQWEPSCSMRTDRHDEANNRFSEFCKRAQNQSQCKYFSFYIP